MATPTEFEVYDELIACADYEAEDSLDKAQRFQSALRRWQLMRPVSSGDSGSTMAFDAAATAAALERVNVYIAAKLNTAYRVRHLRGRNWRK